MTEISDQQLVWEYLHGDNQALEVLVSRHLDAVYAFVFGYVKSRSDAEDITQETFVKAWKNLVKFDQTKNFKTWLFAIAKNTAIDYCRRQKTVPFSAFDNETGDNYLAETLASQESLAGVVMDNTILGQAISSAVNKLLPKYKQVFLLRHEKELAFKEISEISGESVNTVKSRYRRSILKLKKLLDGQY